MNYLAEADGDNPVTYSIQTYSVHRFGGALIMTASDNNDINHIDGFPSFSDEEKHRHILAGLADADAGRTISHEDLLEWVRSLPRPTRI